MKTLNLLLYFLTALIILSSCGNRQEPAEQESSLIEITDRQFTTEGMQLGELETVTFERSVKCNGMIVPLPGGIANVNVPVPGIIRSIRCRDGQWVTANQPLMEISGNEMIDIQGQFAEAAAGYLRSKNEYDRAKLLYDEKVTSEKDFIVADSEYKMSLAKYKGLRMKIEAMGLSASNIENGEFYNSYTIKAPIKGIISNLNAQIGSYIDSQSALTEIINQEMIQLRLSLFATDMMYVKKGQTVRFRPVNADTTYLATLTSIGVAIDNDTKSIDCYASISDNNLTNPIANTYIESEIITSTDSVTALPDAAIIKTERGNLILVLDKQENDSWYFTPVEVTVGRQFNGYSEIVNAGINKKILTGGVYNINIGLYE
ncbi:MAG: efflux RND transporter periplasmic adaptor subunit [Fermentimonas sp.]|nr:efflux RND transporter periplasmic adaptor subunit [Fermentimonas sp.]